MIKYILNMLLFIAATTAAHAQPRDVTWQEAPYLPQMHARPAFQPEQFLSYTIKEADMKAFLGAVPERYEQAAIIYLPVPDGSLRAFRIWRTTMMEEGLAMHFPQITTYTAEAIGARNVSAKLDYSPRGFHALVFDGAGTYLIDPYGNTADGAYMVYYQRDIGLNAQQGFICDVRDGTGQLTVAATGEDALRVNGTVRRKYRLALACTGEYALAVAGPTPTKGAVLSAMVTKMNQVNGVFERELAITMQLVANDTNIIFLDSIADPYQYGHAYSTAFVSENQRIVDSLIGSVNYDIGHVFGGMPTGGVATTPSVCHPLYKASGGEGNPSTPNFYLIVTHEMGHQFFAHHTFNGSGGSCGTESAQASAFEPGSGSTIMAYPGVCGTDNIQSYRDGYFHSASLEEIALNINPPYNGGTCASIIASTNTNAVVPPYSRSYSIPFRTPFELSAPVATDATKDTLTYCWEQRDLGDYRRSLAQTRAGGPLFRSFPPDTSRTRVFPRIQTLIGKAPLIGEKLPDTVRRLTFKFIERDIYQGWGAFNYPDDTIKLSVINTTVPFTVTSPAGGEVYAGGSMQTVTWNTAGTTAAPISCPNVDIYLSADSGYTYPYLLKSGTPNDGSERVTMPVITANAARIKVKSSNNVFFNISPNNFKLNKSNAVAAGTSLQDYLLLSPNPAHSSLEITVRLSLDIVEMRIVNSAGQLAWRGKIDRHTAIDVSSWARGLYQVFIVDKRGMQGRQSVVLD